MPPCNTLFAQGSYLNILGIIRGDSLGSQFGKKVVSTGDVNCDTIPDFLVLATGDQKVYLFYGKRGGLDTIPDMEFEHKSRFDGLGDVNGDGKPDFGMRESGQLNNLSLYFGGIGLDTIRDGFVRGDSGGNGFGLYVVTTNTPSSNVSAGKISDTGDVQILVGDPGYNNFGRVYAFNGKGGIFDSLAFCRLDSVFANGFYGGQIQVLGDINGDSFADFAVGYPTRSDTRPGEVRVFFGGNPFDIDPDLILHPPSYLTGFTAGNFGQLLGGVGDLNGDGVADFVEGTFPLLVYFGGQTFDTLPALRLDRFGYVYVNGGDINGDGYDDLLVGRDEHPITGYAYVYYGGPAMDSIRDLEIREVDLPTPASGFGQTVAGLGDIDGDGSNDFAVGSTSNTDPDRGYLWVFKGLLPSTNVKDGKNPLPKGFTLRQSYPNPFNSSTTIAYTLLTRASVRLEVFNIAGQLVKTLVNAEQLAGYRQIRWDGTDASGKPVSSGIYLYRLTADGEAQTRKMTLIR